MKITPNGSKVFSLLSPDGRTIKVSYRAKYSYIPRLKHRCDHIEFRGYAVSKTGYYSRFFFPNLDFDPSNQEIIDFTRELIEEISGQKYNEDNQLALI